MEVRVVVPVVVALLLAGAGSALVGATTASGAPGSGAPDAPGSGAPGVATAGAGDAASPGLYRSGAAPAANSTASAQPSTDATVTRIRVHANGSATWTVEVRTRLADDGEVEAYRRFQERFRADTDPYLGSFRDRMTRLVDRAGTVTGREMRADGFTATTTIEAAPRRWGVVTYRFRWEGFVPGEGNALVVGDVFQSGYYLGDDDSMVVEAPDGYRIADASPAPTAADDATVRWAGPLDFADGRPAVRMTPSDGTGAADGGSGPGPAGAVPVVPAVVLLVVLLVGAVGGYVVLSGREDRTGEQSPGDGPAADPPGATGDPQADGSGPEGPADGPAGLGELATDEERVVALLERNGGRMRQADVADELDWSAPKTSRVLSSMAEDGDVEKLRIGNENVIDLPERD